MPGWTCIGVAANIANMLRCECELIRFKCWKSVSKSVSRPAHYNVMSYVSVIHYGFLSCAATLVVLEGVFN